LLDRRSPFPLRLLLKCPERRDVAVSRKNVFDSIGAKRADQLILEIGPGDDISPPNGSRMTMQDLAGP